MGRLIDADALKAAMKAVKSGLDFPLSTYLKRIIAMILDGAPIVEAIPVEWLKAQINDAIDDNETELASDIDWLIRKYKNEQEAR